MRRLLPVSLATVALLAARAATIAPPGRSEASGCQLAPALAVLTRDDAGAPVAPARWPAGQRTIALDGPAADLADLDRLDRLQTQLETATGLTLTRTDVAAADIEIRLQRGVLPRATTWRAGGRLTAAAVQWDPTHPHADRWAVEELVHALGPPGDHGPPGAVLSTDQSADGLSGFDRWVLEALYAADRLDRAGLTAALHGRCDERVGPVAAAAARQPDRRTVAGVTDQGRPHG